MLVCESNHGQRWARKAFDAEIPTIMMRKYQEVILAPTGWQWAKSWVIPTKKRFRTIHGIGYSGMNGHRTAAIDGGISTAIGHLHSNAGIAYIKTNELDIWGMNTGSLIDVEAYAFEYGKDSRFKPCLGISVVFNNGSTPVWFPYA